MPRSNPSLVGAKLSHQSARTPRSQASKPTPRQARRPAPEPSNGRARRNLLSRRASSKRFPATITASSSQAFTCAETNTIEPARIGRAGARATRYCAAEVLGKRGRDASDSGSTSCRKRLIPHSTPYSHRLLSRKRRPRRGRQRRPPPTARPRRCGPDAGCEGSPQEAAALQSRRRWHHLGGR